MLSQRDNYRFSTPGVFRIRVPVLARGRAKAGPTKEARALGLAYEDTSPKAPAVGAVSVDTLKEYLLQ